MTSEEQTDMILITIVLGIIGIRVSLYFQQAYIDTRLWIDSLGWKLYVILFLVTLPFILLGIYIINKNIQKKKKEIVERQESVSRHRSEVKHLLNKKIDKGTQKIEELVKELEGGSNKIGRYSELDQEYDRLQIKIEKARKYLEKSKIEDHIRELRESERSARKEVEYWETKRKKQIEEEIRKRRDVLRNLEQYGEHIFREENLTPMEINVLSENGYERKIEYDVKEKKLISVFIKRIPPHSTTHEFLVWSIRRLLKDIKGITRIQTDFTVDADITFNYGTRNIAIEVETGSLLKVKKQLARKVERLNDKYGNSWFFVVSNKNLIPRYRKFGPVTTRRGVAERLQKLLKTPTP